MFFLLTCLRYLFIHSFIVPRPNWRGNSLILWILKTVDACKRTDTVYTYSVYCPHAEQRPASSMGVPPNTYATITKSMHYDIWYFVSPPSHLIFVNKPDPSPRLESMVCGELQTKQRWRRPNVLVKRFIRMGMRLLRWFNGWTIASFVTLQQDPVHVIGCFVWI